jgi:hypothetical protein
MSRKNRRDLPEEAEVSENIQNIQPDLAKTMSFDMWWTLAERRLKLKPELKEAVKKHFKSRGFLTNNDFEAGIKDFGIN